MNARQRYNQSDKGRATNDAAKLRYRRSEAGKATALRARRRYRKTAKYKRLRLRGRLRRAYDISWQDFEARLLAQAGRCGCCDAQFANAPSEPAVDHDHTTGALRDLLCTRCNLGIGYLEVPGFPSAALAYLARHKSA
jgi:hypothetical protein